MYHESRSADPWSAAQQLLECPRCKSDQGLNLLSQAELKCNSCQDSFPHSDGILHLIEGLEGNNKISADFYNGQNWQKYQFWKRFTPFNERAVNRWRAEVLGQLPDLSGTRLLDVAIGDGRNLPRISPACDVFGVDISASQLQQCHRNHADRRLWLIHGEAERLPFRDNTFDNVLSFGAFNYFNDPLGGLQEMARVVKPQGLIVITDEYADLPDRMIGHRIGLPGIDRWILSRFLHLGAEFTDMLEEYRDLKLEPIFAAGLRDWRLTNVCKGVAYCVVGQGRKSDELPSTDRDAA